MKDNCSKLLWRYDDYDQLGRHYYCINCGMGIVVDERLGKWTPNECPNCGASSIENS